MDWKKQLTSFNKQDSSKIIDILEKFVRPILCYQFSCKFLNQIHRRKKTIMIIYKIRKFAMFYIVCWQHLKNIKI